MLGEASRTRWLAAPYASEVRRLVLVGGRAEDRNPFDSAVRNRELIEKRLAG
jgi:hypothetical protein